MRGRIAGKRNMRAFRAEDVRNHGKQTWVRFPGAGAHHNAPVHVIRSWPAQAGALAVGLLLVLLGWAVLTPVGSSPDDDYHLASIWCAAGERSGACEIDPENTQARLVREDVADAYRCYAFNPEVNASCTEELSSDPVSTTRVNQTAGLYPPGFYAAMGALVGDDPAASVLAMRVVNSLLAAGLLFAGLVLAPRGIARAVAFATLIVYVPIGLYIIPSTNPSSWALSGVAAFWTFGLSLMLVDAAVPRWRIIALALGVVVGAVLAVSSRLDSSAYLSAVTVVIAVLVGIGGVRRRWWGGLLLVAMAVLGLFVYVTTEPPVAPGGEALGTSDPGIGLLLTNSVNVIIYLQEAVGGPLGWYDIPLPTWVPIIGTLAIGFVLYRQLSFGRSRVLAASGIALAAFVLVPLAFLQLAGLVVGELIQPRYLLPLLFVLVATASLAPRIVTTKPWPRAVLLTMLPALTVSAALSLWYTAHRYAAGSTQGLFDRDLVTEWNGLTGIPWLLVVLIAMSATAFTYAVGYLLVSPRRDESVT